MAKKTATLHVFRMEKKNGDGELVQAGGWKTIGKGQLRVLQQDGVHFIEFRPEVSDRVDAPTTRAERRHPEFRPEVSDGTSGAEPEDSMVGKQRLGRAVLRARLSKGTQFDVTKNSIQTSLASRDAAGNAIFARYHMRLESEAQANELAQQCHSCVPAALMRPPPPELSSLRADAPEFVPTGSNAVVAACAAAPASELTPAPPPPEHAPEPTPDPPKLAPDVGQKRGGLWDKIEAMRRRRRLESVQ